MDGFSYSSETMRTGARGVAESSDLLGKPRAENNPPDDVMQITEQAEWDDRRLQSAQREIQTISGVGEGADGKVRVRADADGRIAQISLDPRVMKLSSQDLAEAVVLAVRRAQEDSAMQCERVVRDAVGELPATPEQALEQFDRTLDTFSRAMDEHEFRLDQIFREMDGR
ncbi:YbaB/EbfC family nucleoid-associated protein [Nonomuraea sp. B19D2]|uniref:YbaB/EbfC family nucleoid-associated protein n=1 Tax=Nonomuraea sp. B19D2 TaxID=3159561 RepID=UPI0032DB966F